MEDNTKFYIFDRKEIALIFVFMLLVAIVSFVLGVKFGLGYSYESAGLDRADRMQVDLLSTKEEQVNQLLDKKVAPESEEQNDEMLKGHSVKKLKEELDTLDSDPAAEAESNVEKVLQDTKPNDPSTSLIPQKSEAPAAVPPQGDELSGKVTIQLAAFRSLDDAKAFADGFKARGYNTIISDKNIPAKGGLWYRVSIGVFNNSEQAKAFINKNSSLFATQDSQITVFE